MAETKWTPGPWEVDPHLLKVKAACGSVAETIVANPLWPGGPDIDEKRANAHLIAAAPDLYALLERVLNAGQWFYSALEIDVHEGNDGEDIKAEIIAALAKARGESDG